MNKIMADEKDINDEMFWNYFKYHNPYFKYHYLIKMRNQQIILMMD